MSICIHFYVVYSFSGTIFILNVMCFGLSYSQDDQREETNQKHIVFELTTIVLLCLPHFVFDNLLVNQGRAF